ncbi:hypothetical protein GS501_04605 [Saccharibacter sp. 17.LH.SD]|uniref:hypothetical protein n=1 Tax=Saccharibacter sp. 17.LH.SD TaxID=2689393 RepID=UPI001371724E|nr:hypothetical protein [Saccharibacter sp. 17.LH.SD]MXV44326.1 hypothetical protein [Saccharibacter sp. 17.LH.SD]
MPSLDEISNTHGTPLSAALKAGLSDISYNQRVSFKQFRRVILPSDGFVFWVACSPAIDVYGSLHIRHQATQEEWQSFDKGTVTLTTRDDVRPFYNKEHEVDHLWIGSYDTIKFSLSTQETHYAQAELQHYDGTILPPVLVHQLIETEAELDGRSPIVSNSLPFFLAMKHDTNPALAWCAWPQNIPVFPSFSVPNNQPPPYVSVHNDEDSLQATHMGAVDITGTSTDTLVQERVRLHFVGLNHQDASTILTFIPRWALLNWGKMGVLNTPVLRDDKQPLADLNTLASLKRADIDVMYSQHAARSVAFQTIQSAKLTLQSAVKNPKLQTISHAHVALRTSL